MSDIDYRLSELERRFENLMRYGTVEQLDEAAARVRVRSGGMLTGWLPWFTHRAGADRSWHAPEEGEQVVVFSPSGEPAQGVVLPAIYQSAHPAPADAKTLHRMVYDDGTVIEYDRAGHKLLASVRGDAEVIADNDITATAGRNATVSAAAQMTLIAPQIFMQGNLSATNHAGTGIATETKQADTDHTGSYTLHGGHTINGNLQVNGNISATGTIIDGGGNTNNHSH